MSFCRLSVRSAGALIGGASLLVTAACGEFHSPSFGSPSPPPPAGDASSLPLEPSPYEIDDCAIDVVGAYGQLWNLNAVGDELSIDQTLGTPIWAELTVREALDVPFTWRSLNGGDSGVTGDGGLPLGVSLNQKTGELMGVVAEDGDFVFRVVAESAPRDGRRYVCSPLTVAVHVVPACVTDADCVLEGGLADVPVTCDGEALKGAGGVCTREVKRDLCPEPASDERFKVWLHGSEQLPPGAALTFVGEVESHRGCDIDYGTASEDAWGDGGHCLTIRAEEPLAISTLADGAEVTRPELTYYLPHNYPLTRIKSRERYLFHYVGGSDTLGRRFGEGTLFVFSLPRKAEGLEAPLAPEDIPHASKRLVFAGHTGHLLPDELLRRCQLVGMCPELAASHLVPTGCPPVTSFACGDRSPTMVAALTTDGSSRQLLAGQGPALIAKPGRCEDDATAADSFAIHLASSEAFLGDQAIVCYDAEDDYRVSYFVLPSDSCLLSRPRAIEMTDTLRTAPADVKVVHDDDFSPSGREMTFVWTVAPQPAANLMFAASEPPHPNMGNPEILEFTAWVPGFYYARVEASDDRGAPACGIDEFERFEVYPQASAYVEMHHQAGTMPPIELRVAPLDTPGSALRSLERVDTIASPSKTCPDWGLPESHADAPLFWQPPSDFLVEDGVVQTFQAGEALEGQYRVVVLFREQGWHDLGPAAGDTPDSGVTVHVRVIVGGDLVGETRIKRELSRCDLWDVGVLDMDAEPPVFRPNDVVDAFACK